MLGDTRVVVGVDGSLGGLAALHRAAGEAAARGAVLVPLIAWAPSERDGLRPLSELEHAARRRLDTAFAQVFGGCPAGLVVRPVVVRGEAGRALVAEAGRPDDLLVIGTGGHGRLHRALHGSVARYCRAHALCPVLAVSPERLLESLARALPQAARV